MELRYQPGQSIRLTLAGSSPRPVNAIIATMTGRQARLRIDEHLAPGSAVRINFEDAVLFCEIRACSTQGDGYLADLEICEAVLVESPLANFVAAIQSHCQSQPEASLNSAETVVYK
jgi:hypothetical protein